METGPTLAEPETEAIAEPAPTPASDPVLTATRSPELDSIPKAEPEPKPEVSQTPQPSPASETRRLPEPLPQIPELNGLDAQPAPSAADIFASRDAEMANLTARIQAQSTAYAQRKRRKAISTATREYAYASYMEAWRRKVERIGNLNYPGEARELGLFGSLILHVAVRADGSIERLRVVRSSGHEVLDQAAIRIVELAAPFAEFPPDIRRETDVLDITRTWQFQRNNQLGWDN
jgi:protein TonB